MVQDNFHNLKQTQVPVSLLHPKLSHKESDYFPRISLTFLNRHNNYRNQGDGIARSRFRI